MLLTNTQTGYNSGDGRSVTCTLNSGSIGIGHTTGVNNSGAFTLTGSGSVGEAVTQTSGAWQTTTTYENGEVIVDLTTHA